MFYEDLCSSSQGFQTLPTSKASYCLKFVFASETSLWRIINNYWTRLGKIYFFVGGEQINWAFALRGM